MKEHYCFLLSKRKIRTKRNGLKGTSKLILMFAFFSFLFSGTLFAQEGGTCMNPIEIPSLPFDDEGNTADYGNEYNGSDVPAVADNAVTTGTGNTSYMLGEEAVYSFTPAEDGTVTISTTNHDDWTALWVFTGCPFSSTVGYHTQTNGTTREIADLPVTEGETYYVVISDWNGSVEYTIDITGDVTMEGEEDCTEAVAGTIEGPDSACEGSSFTLTAEGSSSGAAGLTRQWQSSEDGDNWEDIEGANNKTVFLEITEDTYFRYTVSCEDEEDATDAFLVTLSPGSECYCIPTGANNNGDEIRNFTLSNIDNDSGASEGTDGYMDYTNTVGAAELEIGEQYTASLTSGTGSGNHGAAIWIDFNDNGIFEEDEMIAYLSNITGNSTVDFPTFTVANHPGIHRLRVQYTYNQQGENLDPCSVTTVYSETEDYLVDLITLEACEGDVTAGTPTETEIEVCANTSFTLEVENSTPNADGLTRVWQSSPAGEDDWTDIDDSNIAFFTMVDGVSEDTDFRYKVECGNSDETDTSDIIEVTLKPANECYCVPGGTNSIYYIDNFSTTEGVQNIENLGSGYADNGYGDYTETHTVSQVHTESVSFEATYSGGTFGTKVWVDWDQDGIFSDDEIVYQSSTYQSSTSGSFEVPESALLGETRMRIGISYTPSSGPNDPCEVGTREFEDYTFEVLALEDCQGTPTAGTVETEMEICAGVAFDLITEGSSDPAGGLDRIWQSSPAGEDDWTDIAGSNSSEFTVEDGISEDTDFRYKVVCNNSDETDFSAVIEVSLKPGNECYCQPPTPSFTDLYWIESVNTDNAIEDISNNNTGFAAGGYADYYDTHTVTVEPGGSFDIEVEAQTGASPGLKIWIDWNNNGSFDDEGELVYETTSGATSSLNTYSATIEVPSDASGTTRMRIRNYIGAEPCNQLSYGETEDYSVEMTTLDDCTEAIAGTISANETEVCPDSSFTLSVSDHSEPAEGLTRMWQSSPAGEDDWTDLGSGSTNYNTSITEDTDFRYYVSCSNSDESDFSNVIEMTLKPSNQCYCEPGGTNSNYYINDFSTTGGVQNIENLNSGFSDGGYGDFTDTHIVSQAHTESIEFSATYATGSTFGTKIWVDWNQDGQFSDDEIVYQTSAYSNSESGTIEVPETAELGETRMRIGISYTPSSGPNDPCESGSREFEDYTFEVLALEDCEGTPTAGTVETEMEVCAGVPFHLVTEGSSDPAAGLDRVWQSSPAGEDDWTDIDESNSADFILADGITEETDFRYKVVCNNSGETDISDVIEVTIKPAEECYCIPEGTNSGRYIDNFSTSNGFENISNLNSGFSDGGYGDFTDMTVSQINTQEVSFETDIVGGTAGFRVWVDWNRDGQFSSDEVVYQSSGYSSSHSGTFIVPDDAPEGETVMRIVSHWSSTTGDVDPCATGHIYGEFEDYTFEIVNPTCYPPTNIEIDYVTDNSAQVTWEANDESEWIVIYGETGFDPETEGDSVTVTEPLADLIDLNDETDYEVYVQTLCETEESVMIGPRSFTTNITPPENTRLCDAFELTPNSGCIDGPFTNVAAFEEANEPVGSCLNNFHGTNTVWFSFVATDTEALVTTDFNSTDFLTEIVVFEAPDDCSDVTTLGDEVACASSGQDGNLQLEGLTIGDTYYVKVAGFNQAEGLFCLEVQMDESDVCLDPTDISVDDIQDISADISWTSTGSAAQWEVLYGLEGFDMETEGESMIVNQTQATLTNLEPETDYEVYVRAICGDDFSGWAGPEGFLTDEMGVDNQIFQDFSFYPNPVKDVLNLQAGNQIEKVEFYNLLGQKVLEVNPNALETTIDTDRLQSGTYLMNVNIDGFEKSYRVIKK